MGQLKKTAVVTGSSRGIGRCIAENLEKAGYNAVYADISFAEETETKTSICVKCDISDPESRQRLLEKTIEKFGRVDMLVNNAGVAPAVRLDILETTTESFERLIRINLEGTFFMSQLFANQMIKQQKDSPEPCRIINIASMSSYTSSTSRGEYCISKAGVSMVTKLFADRLAEYGIGVFEIRPGIILTDMTAVVKEKYEKMIADGLTPIKRFGQPDDIADVVMAVAGGNFDFCTGQVFNADGGFHIRRL